jgi:hypothetical protein
MRGQLLTSFTPEEAAQRVAWLPFRAARHRRLIRGAGLPLAHWTVQTVNALALTLLIGE